MHHATSFRAEDLAPRERFADHSEGYRHVSHISREIGAIHTDLGTGDLSPGGTIDPHVHSYRYERDWAYLREREAAATTS